MSQLIEILEKFENGQERYRRDSNFTEVVVGLRRGLGVYAVLDGTLKKLARAEAASANAAEALRLEKAELEKDLDIMKQKFT